VTVLDLRVEPERAGGRLDQYLAACLPDRTRSFLRRLIEQGRVSVDGRPAPKAGLLVAAGMRVSVTMPGPVPDGPQAEEIPLDVLYEDDALLALNKPAGLVVHRGHGRAGGTLVNALLGRGTPLSSTGAPDRPGIVHRLDLGTSGVLVVAKTDAAYHALTAAFAARRVGKRYAALVWGHPLPDRAVIERPIGRSRADRTRMAVRATGRFARTRYETRERLAASALLDVYPETGRTHQIRVHLHSIHHPVIGDERYGRARNPAPPPAARAALARFRRLALHAAALELPHPADGRTLSLEAPLPPDLLELIQALRRP